MPVTPLGEWDLRTLFNASGIWDRAVAGDLLIVRREKEPNPAYHQPADTISVRQDIYDPNQGGGLMGLKVAETHHYESPSGEILNAAGLPDPKMVRAEGIVYVLRNEPPPPFVPLVPQMPPPGPPPTP